MEVSHTFQFCVCYSADLSLSGKTSLVLYALHLRASAAVLKDHHRVNDSSVHSRDAEDRGSVAVTPGYSSNVTAGKWCSSRWSGGLVQRQQVIY